MKVMKKAASFLAAVMMGMSLFSFTVSAEESERITDGRVITQAIRIYLAENDIECVGVIYIEKNDEVRLIYDSHIDSEYYDPLIDSFVQENNMYPTLFTAEREGIYIEMTPGFVYTPSAPRYLLGDVDGDSTVTAEDAQFVLAAYAETLVGNEPSLTVIQRKAADPNGDGALTAEDSQYILRYYAANTLAQNDRSWIDIIIRDLY